MAGRGWKGTSIEERRASFREHSSLELTLVNCIGCTFVHGQVRACLLITNGNTLHKVHQFCGKAEDRLYRKEGSEDRERKLMSQLRLYTRSGVTHLKVSLVAEVERDVMFAHLPVWLGCQLYQGVQGKFHRWNLLGKHIEEVILSHP